MGESHCLNPFPEIMSVRALPTCTMQLDGCIIADRLIFFVFLNARTVLRAKEKKYHWDHSDRFFLSPSNLVHFLGSIIARIIDTDE